MANKTVGVLALQGDFEAHRKSVDRVGARGVEVRTAADLAVCDGLIVPGGESTTMLKLLGYEPGLEAAILEFAKSKAMYGTCAGAILMARAVTHPAQRSWHLMDIDVERNAYGRQIDSRIATIGTEAGEVEAVFIRAPIIRAVADGVHVVAVYQGDPVWVEQGRHMVTTFHPELSATEAIHRRFLEKL